jgi:hypothetical protein
MARQSADAINFATLFDGRRVELVIRISQAGFPFLSMLEQHKGIVCCFMYVFLSEVDLINSQTFNVDAVIKSF